MVLKFDNLRYEGSTCFVGLLSGFVFRVLSWVVVCRFLPWYSVLTGCGAPLCLPRSLCGGCFSAMRMGCFLIFVAPKDYWMLGLCTSHAFFSLLNVFVHLDGC